MLPATTPVKQEPAWQYLPDDALLSDRRQYQRIEGPRIVGGKPLVTWVLHGQGLEQRNYRSYDSRGVHLHMRSVPGAEITFDPPIVESPPAGSLTRGATWSSRTKATIYAPAVGPGNARESTDIEYTYSVVDRRRVSVTAGSFDVYVMNAVTTSFAPDGSELESLTQEVWFSPYVGEIRTLSGDYLVEMNFQPTYPQ